MLCEVRATAFEPWEELRRYQAERLDKAGAYGATTSFVGTMRDFNEGDAVRAMTLEHYPAMTEKYLSEIAVQATRQWDIIDCLIIHRSGDLRPDDPIVVVAVWAGHRREAFEACRFLIEELKHKAPFWKKEILADGARWVTGNTPG